MVSSICSTTLKSWRSWGLGFEENSQLHRLSFLESRFPNLSHESQNERVFLVQSTAYDVHKSILSRIQGPKIPGEQVKALEEKVAQLRKLLIALYQDPHSYECRCLFFLLPKDIQDTFYWAVWMHFGAPMAPDFGRDKLVGQISLLVDIRLPWAFTSGVNLCEQLIHRLERSCVLQRQKDVLSQLQELEHLLKRPSPNLEAISTAISALPAKLLSRIHADIQSIYPHHCGAEWQLHANPKLLRNLFPLESTEPCLLSQYLKEQREVLGRLEEGIKLEEYERYSILSHAMSIPQRQALLAGFSQGAAALVLQSETALGRHSHLNRDCRHLYQWRGAHPTITGTSFHVYAPHARDVHVVLTAYGKEEHEIPMKRTAEGTWEVFSEHAHPGRTYRYKILDAHGRWGYRTDPFSVSIREREGIGESVVCSADAHYWSDNAWMTARATGKPLEKPLSVYQLNVELWKKKDGRILSFEELAEEIIFYNKKCNFTHVLLSNVIDNKGEGSWGYHPSHYFAPNRRLGGIESFCRLVDRLHQEGIGVFLDFIPAHYKHEHCGEHSESLHNFDGTNLFAAGKSPWDSMYFDFSRPETHRLLMASALYWLEVCHLDGMRFDAVYPMLMRDGGVQMPAVKFLQEFNAIAHQRYPGIMTIAEETNGFPNVTLPVEQGGLGFDAKFAPYFQQRARNYFKTPDVERRRGEHHYGKLMANLNDVGGDERWMLGNTHDDTADDGSPYRHSTLYRGVPADTDWRRFANQRAFHAWHLFSPAAGHLIHMGDEVGQIWPWNTRLSMPEGAVEWHLLDSRNNSRAHWHSGLLDFVGDLNRLYRSQPAFWRHGDRGYLPISNYAENCVVGFYRLESENKRLAVFFNFSTMGYAKYDFPLPPLHEDSSSTRILGMKEVLNSDDRKYKGTGAFKNTWADILRNPSGMPTHMRFAFPPLSVLVFEVLMG